MSKIVNKVWGRELWFANTDQYCGKILELKKGYRCSVHKHRIKDETFYILSGKVFMEVWKMRKAEQFVMQPGDSVRIPPNQYHRFNGLQASEIIEVSTHHDDDDSYRLVKSGKMSDATKADAASYDQTPKS